MDGQRQRSFRHPALKPAAVFLAVVVIAFSLRDVIHDDGRTNLHVHQARAFLNGRLHIATPPERYLHDLSVYEGKSYVIFPPFPTVILMPLVAVFGMSTRVMLVSMGLTVINVFSLKRILLNLAVERDLVPWILAAFFCGTGYWFCVCWSGGVWYYSIIVGQTGLLLAIREATGKGRGYLAGLFLGMAFLSRQLAIYSTVFLCALLWDNATHRTTRPRLVSVAGLLAVCGAAVCVSLALNAARFGNPFDTGYAYIPLQSFLLARFRQYGLFHPAYIPFNLVHMFLQGFHIEWGGPDLLTLKGMDFFGTSLTFASPFVFFAFKARPSRTVRVAAWCSITLTLVHLLHYYTNGFVQINTQRYAMDFLPLATILVALSARHVNPRLLKTAIAYSVLLNVIALALVPALQYVL